MPYTPWTFVGWLLAVILMIVIVGTPVAFAIMLRVGRQSRQAFEAHRARYRDLAQNAGRQSSSRGGSSFSITPANADRARQSAEDAVGSAAATSASGASYSAVTAASAAAAATSSACTARVASN